MAFKRIKVSNSHTGHARMLAECDWTDDDDMVVVGYLANVQCEDIPSPYAYSPSQQIYRCNGRKVIIREVRHRRYEMYEVPANMLTFKTDDEATEWNTRFSRKPAA